jgi:hypothetical protein
MVEWLDVLSPVASCSITVPALLREAGIFSISQCLTFRFRISLFHLVDFIISHPIQLP